MKDLQAERARVAGLLEGVTPGEWVNPWDAPDDAEEQASNRISSATGEPVVAHIVHDGDVFLRCKRQDAALIAAAPALARDYAAALGEVARLRGLLEAVGHDLANAVGALDFSSALVRQYVWDAHDRLSALASAPEERP